MPKRVEYFGGAKELHPEELPSIRDVICFAKSLQDSLPGKSLGLASNEIGIGLRDWELQAEEMQK